MTKPIRVLIADDEPLGRSNVRVALQDAPDVEIVAECENGDETADAIGRLKPDLVFLDVQMPGSDAFGVIERVGPEHMPPVVFVTAHDEYAVPAFRVHALDFLLKPFDDDRFRDALERARARLEQHDGGELARRLRDLLRELGDAGGTVPAAGRYITRFGVKHDGGIIFVRAPDVDYFESAGNYVTLHVRDKAYSIRSTIQTLIRSLDPNRFQRIHRSTIVNVDRLKELQPWFGSDYIAVLHDGRKLKVSRTYSPSLTRSLHGL